MSRNGPPAYAWDWFSRQRLPWREARRRLAQASAPAAARYAAVDTRSDVVPMLRADYPRDPLVRSTVDEVVREIAFLDRTDVPFARLGMNNAPRGLRWWWTALTGEELEPATSAAGGGRPAPAQLSLDEVNEGYGG